MQNTSTTNRTRQLARVYPDGAAKIVRPKVAKQRFSRSVAEAVAQDPVDTSVQVRYVTWTEVAFSDCAYGCKVYRSSQGRHEIQHNGNYNCPRAGERIKVPAPRW